MDSKYEGMNNEELVELAQKGDVEAKQALMIKKVLLILIERKLSSTRLIEYIMVKLQFLLVLI